MSHEFIIVLYCYIMINGKYNGIEFNQKKKSQMAFM